LPSFNFYISYHFTLLEKIYDLFVSISFQLHFSMSINISYKFYKSHNILYYHRSTRIKCYKICTKGTRSLCKRISPCLTRLKRILLRTFYKIPIQSQSNWQEDKSRKKKRPRKRDSWLKIKLKKTFYSRDRWILSR